jgi:hypothetical protein
LQNVKQGCTRHQDEHSRQMGCYEERRDTGEGMFHENDSEAASPWNT